MKKLFLILLTIISFGCSKDYNTVTNPQTETFELTTESNSVMPQGFVIVNTNITLEQSNYTGTFGGQNIELYKSSDNELIFTVPEINSGNQTLELEIDDKIGSLNFQVSENNVQNPDNIITTELINPINSMSQDISNYLTNNSFSQEVTNSLHSADQMLNDFLTKFNTLSDDEKMEVAKFYNANPLFTTDFFYPASRSTMTGNSDYDCFDVNSRRVVLTTVIVLGFVKALPSLNAATPLGFVTAAVGFIAGVYAAHSILSAAHELLINECFLPFEHALNDGLGNSNDFEVNNGSFQNFTIITKDRHIIASDTANSNAVVAFTIEKMNLVKSKWNTLKDGVNNIITSTSNWFSGWFGSSSSSYEPITYDYDDIPESSEEVDSEGDSEFITIEDFPSDVNVEVNVTSDNSIDLKLTAEESTLPRTVTGKIKYNDGDFQTSDPFSVLLEQVTDSTAIYQNAVIGNWTVQTLGSPDDPYDLTIEPNGLGFYFIEGGANSDDGITYYIDWYIYQENGRYFLREDGFYHPGFEQYRSFDITLPDNALSFPVTSFKTYNDFNNGDGPYASRIYTKN